MSKNELPVSLLPAERTWGIRYLLFELVFLGPILSLLLPSIWSGAKAIHVDTAYFAVNCAAVCFIFRRFLVSSVRQGFSRFGKVMIAICLGLLVYFAATLALDALYSRLMPEFFNVNDAGILQNSRESRALTAVGTVLLVPVAEETLHRGLIFGLLHRKKRTIAYLLSALVFCFIHVTGYIGAYQTPVLLLCFLQYLPAGLTLAWAYEYSGSILAPIIMHTAVNTIAMLTMR